MYVTNALVEDEIMKSSLSLVQPSSTVFSKLHNLANKLFRTVILKYKLSTFISICRITFVKFSSVG